MPDTDAPAPASSCQILRVLAADWCSDTATLQRFTRPHRAQDWQAFGDEIPVSLGRSGLAWGIGLHPAANASESRKREGDGCAPAGIFAITALFGEAGPESAIAQSARLPYRCTGPQLKCIDDTASRYYNRVIDQETVDAVDWRSHEEMLRADERYVIGAVIAHNAACLPGQGSCIFLHVWQAAGVPTAGCTAASLADMTEICNWLDAACNPLIVQLPEAEYRRRRKAWNLP
ncbi:L,D-transpeptidase [Dechloromonas sp. ARDL1]|uniref:L,D-transpeptidase family protein n=1 Tax=Dechloromonas sp. ARDL1 TaxID=3322121 RepID=UPI003DA714DC